MYTSHLYWDSQACLAHCATHTPLLLRFTGLTPWANLWCGLIRRRHILFSPYGVRRVDQRGNCRAGRGVGCPKALQSPRRFWSHTPIRSVLPSESHSSSFMSTMRSPGGASPNQGMRQPVCGGDWALEGCDQTWSPPTRFPNHQPEKSGPSRVSQ